MDNSERAKEKEAMTSEAKGKKLAPFFTVASVCLVLAFIIPYSLTYKMASNQWSPGIATRAKPAERILEDATQEARRAGFMGALMALFILLIWKLDRAMFAKDTELTNNKKFMVVIFLLAFMLWVAWASAGYIVIRVNDEITDEPPDVPGFHRTN